MTKTVIVTGDSDDTIRIDSVGRPTEAEFYAHHPAGALVNFSDGTVLWIRRPVEEWRITVEEDGAAQVTLDEAPVSGLDRDDTDRATVVGEFTWIQVADAVGGGAGRRIDL